MSDLISYTKFFAYKGLPNPINYAVNAGKRFLGIKKGTISRGEELDTRNAIVKYKRSHPTEKIPTWQSKKSFNKLKDRLKIKSRFRTQEKRISDAVKEASKGKYEKGKYSRIGAKVSVPVFAIPFGSAGAAPIMAATLTADKLKYAKLKKSSNKLDQLDNKWSTLIKTLKTSEKK